jgi:hypothetical protein
MDIDCDDCASLVMILEAGYRPRVLQCEVAIDVPVPCKTLLHCRPTLASDSGSERTTLPCNVRRALEMADCVGPPLLCLTQS